MNPAWPQRRQKSHVAVVHADHILLQSNETVQHSGRGRAVSGGSGWRVRSTGNPVGVAHAGAAARDSSRGRRSGSLVVEIASETSGAADI